MIVRGIALTLALTLAGATGVPAARVVRGGAAAAGAQSRSSRTTPVGVGAPAARVLAAIQAADTGRLAVSEEDGRFLRAMVTATGARSALEIGAASGYSAIWLGLGLRETGGRLVTIEYDAARAAEAAANIRQAGLADVVRVVSGDGFVEIPKLPGPFDFVFLDAWKRDYKRFFDLVFPRVTPGGAFLAHNVINKRHEMGDFLRAIETHPQAFTSIVSPASEGISVTVKRRP
jgi:predicted O-methyltransferase YrrM